MIKLLSVVLLIASFSVTSSAQLLFDCTHKQNEWNRWVPLEPHTLITVLPDIKTISVKEIENVETIIKYDAILHPADGSTMYAYKKIVSLCVPAAPNNYLITVFRNNYICPVKENNE